VRTLAAVALVAVATTAGAQTRVVITDMGHGASGRILAAALAQPHRLAEPADSRFVLRRNEQVSGSLIVLGRSAAIEGNVEGDVIVVDGDLFVRPGGRIGGRAIAIGGGAYPSALAIVGGGTQSFRDNTFRITPTETGYRLEYGSLREHASSPLLFPGVYGLRMPSYDRSNGASVPFGPTLTFAGGRGEANLIGTYRSDIGAIDPSLDASLQLSRRVRASASAGRGTFSNEEWIWSDLLNSGSVLTSGEDTRNWFRADRAELTVHQLWEGRATQVEPYLGVRAERAWSIGPAVGERRGPWSVLGRADTLAMWRPNPAVDDGSLTTVLVGASAQFDDDVLRVGLRTAGEIALASPTRTFNQVTSDLAVGFPTFGEQRYELDVHWVTTFGDAAPRQRYAYLGGSGTLTFLELLEQGGGEALLVDQRYSIPLVNVRVGILGIPTLLVRHRLGSAGLGRLPAFEQLVGVGVMLVFIRGEVRVDATTGDVRFSTGFSFSR